MSVDKSKENGSKAAINDDSEDENDVIEESPCGRWLKRSEQVDQRDVPGIDNAYMAMDTEFGVEVVWNEVQFSERKNFKAQEEKIREVFESLSSLWHPNIVKFHRYWTDTHDDQPRVIFITEYMSSGSLKQFLKHTKRNEKKLSFHSWKRWCRQILSALSYLHSCNPPIVHGYLTCDSIFIQHNGLVKIGSVAPDTIHHHVKTCRNKIMNLHFVAPECGETIRKILPVPFRLPHITDDNSENFGPPIDIYSFGMCALEMAALDIQDEQSISISSSTITEDKITQKINSIEDDGVKKLVADCLNPDPSQRPTAKQLLTHPTLFEVPSLKLVAAYSFILGLPHKANMSEIISENTQDYADGNKIFAIIKRDDNDIEFMYDEIVTPEKLEKFVEDVKNGVHPLTVHDEEGNNRMLALNRQKDESPRPDGDDPNGLEENKKEETRRVIEMSAKVVPDVENPDGMMIFILLRLDDRLNRQLTCSLTEYDSAESAVSMAQELVALGFIHQDDEPIIRSLVEETLNIYPIY